MKDKNNPGFLNDLLVLELGSVLACPAVGVFLAELGARVIKVENTTTHGDVTRSWKLATEDKSSDISGYFSCVNWGKESLALDLSSSQGIEIIHSLVSQADVVLVNYKAGDASKLGTDYETLKKINPRLIYGQITGYGLDSPRAGYDAIIQGESGFTYMNGDPDGSPTKLPVALMDLLAAHQLKEGILLALLKRQRSGKGDWVDVSLMQAGIASLANQAANWQVGGEIPGRMGSDHPNIVPYGTIFSTADDQEIVLAVGSDKQFARLCQILGQPDLAAHEKYRSNHARVLHRQELKPILAGLIAAHERDPLLRQLQGESIPAGAVNNMRDVLATPQAQAMTLQGELDNAPFLGVRNAVFHFCQTPVFRDHLAVPPHYGQHSAQVLKELLSFSDQKIQSLIEREVIQI